MVGVGHHDVVALFGDDDGPAPRARTSWMFDTIFSCSRPRPSGDGTSTTTGTPSSISAIGPCLSSPAAKPSACM